MRIIAGPHLRAGRTGRAVDPIVETPGQTVQKALHVAAAKTGKDDLSHVCAAVAVCILAKQDIRRGADEHSTVVANYGGRPGEPIDKHAALVEMAVAVGIF